MWTSRSPLPPVVPGEGGPADVCNMALCVCVCCGGLGLGVGVCWPSASRKSTPQRFPCSCLRSERILDPSLLDRKCARVCGRTWLAPPKKQGFSRSPQVHSWPTRTQMLIFFGGGGWGGVSSESSLVFCWGTLQRREMDPWSRVRGNSECCLWHSTLGEEVAASLTPQPPPPRDRNYNCFTHRPHLTTFSHYRLSGKRK